MNTDIDVFDPASASRAELGEYFDLAVAAFAVDRPDAAPPTYDGLIGRTITPLPGVGDQQIWTARAEIGIIAAAIVQYPGEPNAHKAEIELRVHPDWRRKGIGTRLFEALKPELRLRHRRLLAAYGVTADGDGAHWAVSAGFKETHRIALQILTIEDVDPATWHVPITQGYRLERWTGTAPEELVESYARARHALQDAPVGDSTFAPTAWDSREIRKEETKIRHSGVEHRTVVAIHEPSEEVAGFTLVQIHPSRTETAFQGDTAVLAEHRGRSLGLAVKADMMRWLVAERPSLQKVHTTTASDNVYMLNVNQRLGYEVTRMMLELERDIDLT